MKSDSTFESEVMGPHETIIVNASWTGSDSAFDYLFKVRFTYQSQLWPEIVQPSFFAPSLASTLIGWDGYKYMVGVYILDWELLVEH